jgi:hypothetical protein
MAAKNATIFWTSHGGEKRHYFLDMMSDVISFLPDFHHDVGYRSVRLLKPGVLLI